mgnify:CR=1 FL=1
MKKMILPILILILLLTGCSGKTGEIENGYTNFGNLESEQFRRPEIGEEMVVITTNKGVIKARLLEENAPIYVENFKHWVREGAYDGEKFHMGRENGFIGMLNDELHRKYRFKEHYKIENEIDYRVVSGALVNMKVKGEPSSTFAIIANYEIEQIEIDRMENLSEEYGYTREVIKAYKKLGGEPENEYLYSIFGQVFYGMDTVYEISKMPTKLVEGRYHIFIDDIIIEKIEILPYEGDI